MGEYAKSLNAISHASPSKTCWKVSRRRAAQTRRTTQDPLEPDTAPGQRVASDYSPAGSHLLRPTGAGTALANVTVSMTGFRSEIRHLGANGMVEAGPGTWRVGGRYGRSASAGPTRWVRADLYSMNLLARHSRLTAIIDFDGLASVPPAERDMLPSWAWLTPQTRDLSRAEVNADERPGHWGLGWELSAITASPIWPGRHRQACDRPGHRGLPAHCLTKLVS
jgi:hypothetical protein